MPLRSVRAHKSLDSESRTAAFTRKRPATFGDRVRYPHNSASKKRRLDNHTRHKYNPAGYYRVGPQSVRDFVPTGSNFSATEEAFQATRALQNHDSEMFPHDLGTNRLRSGFRGRTMQRSASDPGAPSDSEDEDSASPIQVDLETDDDETDGGITLNVQDHGDRVTPIVISDDEGSELGSAAPPLDSDLEEGEEREAADDILHNQMLDKSLDKKAQQSSDPSFVIDSSASNTYLRDLTSAQLEDQIKYAFWQLPRDEIDLSRLARCLHCQDDGHVDEVCPAKTCSHCNAFADHESVLCPSVKRCDRCREPGHSTCQDMKNNTIPCDICGLRGHVEAGCSVKHYNRQVLPATETQRLWISCCHCASKTHLVGDCQDVTSSQAARWSLRSLDPNQVVNLSLQTGTGKREKEAENRNMRPEGMRIKGRADRHNADVNRRDPSDSDDLENFFSRPPPPRDNRRHGLPSRPQNVDHYRHDADSHRDRYDRYNGPSDTYRPPRNGFYATDSFGRPRSRSPQRYGQRGYGPFGSQSPSSDRSYRPPLDDRPSGRRSPPTLRDNPFTRQTEQSSQNLPARGISIQLPTRKGSNPNMQNNNAPNPQTRPTISTQPAGAKNSNKKQKFNDDGSPWTAHQRMHNGLTKAQRKGGSKKKKNKGKGGASV